MMGVWLFFRAGLEASACVAMETDALTSPPLVAPIYEQKIKCQMVTKEERG